MENMAQTNDAILRMLESMEQRSERLLVLQKEIRRGRKKAAEAEAEAAAAAGKNHHYHTHQPLLDSRNAACVFVFVCCACRYSDGGRSGEGAHGGTGREQ